MAQQATTNNNSPPRACLCSALNFVKGLKENGAEAGAGERIEALQVSVWNNMAAVFLAQKRAARAAEVLSSALALEPRNAKARLRAARAYVALRDGERAREHLRAAQAEMPADDRSLATLEAQVRRLEAADERAQAGFFRNMFSAMADEKAEDTDNNSKVDSKVDNNVVAASSEPIVNADGLQEELATLPDDEE